jgi:hypothetical protein
MLILKFKDFTARVKEKAIGQDVLTTLQPGSW